MSDHRLWDPGPSPHPTSCPSPKCGFAFPCSIVRGRFLGEAEMLGSPFGFLLVLLEELAGEYIEMDDLISNSCMRCIF